MKEKYVTENPLLMLAIMRFFFSLYSSGGEEMRSGKGKGKKGKKKKKRVLIQCQTPQLSLKQ